MSVYHKSCGVVTYAVVDGVREYLLLHYPGGHWDLPKGHAEKLDKDEISTALRELKEETGLTPVEVLKGFMTSIHYEYTLKGVKQKKDVDFFLARVEKQNVVLSHEHKGYEWLNFYSALERITYDNAKDVLIAAEAFLKSLA